MKLAHEIANDLRKAGCMMTTTSANIVEGKLEPIKSCLLRAKRFSRSEQCKNALIEALGMLEEES